jgi:hypothetical protein
MVASMRRVHADHHRARPGNRAAMTGATMSGRFVQHGARLSSPVFRNSRIIEYPNRRSTLNLYSLTRKLRAHGFD